MRLVGELAHLVSLQARNVDDEGDHQPVRVALRPDAHLRGNRRIAERRVLAARDQPASVTGLAPLMGITKQAASKLVEAMVAGGYLERGADPRDGRHRPVHLTDRGHELLRSVEQIYAELEAQWAAVVGASHIQRMRSDLVRVLSGTDGQLPPVRPTW